MLAVPSELTDKDVESSFNSTSFLIFIRINDIAELLLRPVL